MRFIIIIETQHGLVSAGAKLGCVSTRTLQGKKNRTAKMEGGRNAQCANAALSLARSPSWLAIPGVTHLDVLACLVAS